MQYTWSFNLCVCFMVAFIVERASTKKQKGICLPCSEISEWNICESNEKAICIANKLQLYKILAKTGELAAQAESEASKCAKDRVVLIVIFVCAIIGCVFITGILIFLVKFIRKKWFMTSNKLNNQNETTNSLLKENANYDDLELSEQNSLFKKTIDATLSSPELQKLEISMKSVGILFWNNKAQGTVIRIGSKYILTAWHVIEPIVSSAGRLDTYGNGNNDLYENDLGNKGKVWVYFNENLRQVDPLCRFRLLPKICFRDERLDICFLEVDDEGRELPKPIEVFRDFEKMNRGATKKFVHVIGLHPEENNIVVDPGCKIISRGDEKVVEAYKWIKSREQEIKSNADIEGDLLWTYDQVFATKGLLVIDTYLDFGASGAAVISFTPDKEIALVGILIRGLPSWYWTKENCERGFESLLRMEVVCLITEVLRSTEWRASEKEKIFCQSGQTGSSDDTGDKMETDHSKTGALAPIHSTKQDWCNIEMETD